MATKPIPIQSLPGVKRDGTEFEGDHYTDATWCRFQRGKPRKMGGFRSVTSILLEKIYGISSFSSNANQYIHLGSESTLLQAVVDNSGLISASNDRTPVGFTSDADNIWQFTILPNGVAKTSNIIAHAAPNLMDIASTVETPIYYNSDITASSVLTDTGLDPVSGGIVAVGPYLFSYGSAGYLAWTAANDPTTFDASARVTGQKIVRGIPTRGSGTGPSALFWSLDSIVRATFGDPLGTLFNFDELATDISIMSPRSLIEYDGLYYWWGVDRCLMFNGVVREVPNQMNVNYFLDNLNFAQSQKVFAYKVPRFGEIWWCYPRGNATECTHAIIYNVREQSWYDTELPDSGRSDGIFAKVYNKPFLVDVDETATGYTLWQHETGVDKVLGAAVEPIESFFQTADITMLTGDKPENKALRVDRVEPDFVQEGDLEVVVTGRANARAENIVSETHTFPDTASDANEQTVPLKTQRRLMRFKFTSNTPGGDYQLGQTLAHVESADGRITQ